MQLLDIRGRVRNKDCGHLRIEWESPSLSKLQFKVKKFLKKYWYYDVVYEEFPVFGTLLKVDILNATKRIAIEVQGSQHDSYNKYFFGTRARYLTQIKNDFKKRTWLEMNQFKVCEVYDKEVDFLSEAYFLEKFSIKLV